MLALIVQKKSALSRILENQWYSSWAKGKLRFYAILKKLPGFEIYLLLNNPKLRQALTKVRLSPQKLPIETVRYDQKKQMERIYTLSCAGIGNETHYVFEYKSKEMIKVRNKLMEPFYKNLKGLEKLSIESFCRASLSCQNNDLLYEEGLLCLRIQETVELEAFWIN